MMSSNLNGNIIKIQDFSVNDGDGIRTVIFLSGCPLRCKWCANPEGFTTCPKIAFFKDKCHHCYKCRDVCPKHLSPCEDDFDYKECIYCKECIKNCPHKAIFLWGCEMSQEEVIFKIRRDSLFYSYSDGGVTFSGGEPFYQRDFLKALSDKLYDLGIDMWVETSGYYQFNEVKEIFEKITHVFYDIKHMDSFIHKKFTGVFNDLILENAIKIHDLGVPMTIRIPSIKEVNFDEKNLIKTAKFISKCLPSADLELLPYHKYGILKYKALRMDNYIHEFNAPSKNELDLAFKLFKSYGIKMVYYK